MLLDRSQLFFLEAYRGCNRSYRLAMAAIATKAQVPRYLIEGFVVMLIVGLSLTMALRGQGIEQQLPWLGTMALGPIDCCSLCSSVLWHSAACRPIKPRWSDCSRFCRGIHPQASKHLVTATAACRHRRGTTPATSAALLPLQP